MLPELVKAWTVSSWFRTPSLLALLFTILTCISLSFISLQKDNLFGKVLG
jgi:hypothetical protein